MIYYVYIYIYRYTYIYIDIDIHIYIYRSLGFIQRNVDTNMYQYYAYSQKCDIDISGAIPKKRILIVKNREY